MKSERNVKCSYCGGDFEIGDMMREADFEGDTFYDCVKDYLNPWDGGDEYACIPYSCHCPLCGKYIRAEVIFRADSIEIQDDELDTVDYAVFRMGRDDKFNDTIVYDPNSVNVLDAIDYMDNAITNLSRFSEYLNNENISAKWKYLLMRWERFKDDCTPKEQDKQNEIMQ